MGEQRGRGRREVSCHRFLVYTIPDRPVLGSCISPIPCVYFTYSLGCFGGLQSTHFTNHLALLRST
jgi:hypothetical protein